MRRLYTLAFLCSFLLSSHRVDCRTIEVDGIYYYELSNNTVAVTYHIDGNDHRVPYTMSNIVIPSRINWYGNIYNVVEIGGYAFDGCSSLASVTIPNSVTSIGDYAFYECRSLAFITIPNSVTSIGEFVFRDCRSLTSITIPNSVTSIGNCAFSDCSSLTSVTISNSVTNIGINVFAGCKRLTSVTIPNSVTSIGSGAFYGCKGLTSVTIPNSVTSIGEFVFRDCSSLTSITIPNSVTSIGNCAFSDCSSLNSIVVENGNPVYDSRNNCNAIIYRPINELVAGCKRTTIPNSVTSIGYCAFNGCDLKSITIPNSVKNIGYSAFAGTGLTSVTIPNSVTSIGESAFAGCRSLTSVTIPNSVTSIEDYAFNGCTSLTSVTSLIENPFSINANCWEYVRTGVATLYVPAGTKEKYKSTAGWNVFSNIEEIGAKYTLTITATGNGSASYNGTTIRGKTTSFTVNEGTNATITFSPDTGYRIKSVKVNNSTVTVSNNQYTVSNISKNTTVSVEFEVIPPTTYTLSITATGSGSAAYNGTTVRGGTKSFTVNEGTNATIIFTPDAGYRIKSVKVNNTAVSVSSNQYTVSNISRNTTVEVEFEAAITELAVGGVSYKVVSLGNRTLRVTSGEYGQVLHVPATVSYQGLMFTVVGIENGALANATELAAVIWEPQARFTESVSNPNLLLYVSRGDYAPAGIQNVVVDGTAERIVLTEAQNGNDFYCPEEFTARSISLTHQYGMTSGMGVCQGWESIVLPFEVQRVAHESKGTMVPFAAWGGTEDEKPFWLYELGSGGWMETTTIRANVPYIISVPNHQNYRDSYRLPGRVTFSAENARVKRTDEAAAVSGGGRTLVPNFRQRAASNEVFALNVVNQFDADTDGAAEGSQFVRSLRQVHPFEAYMTATATTRGDVIPVFEEGETTGVNTMHNYESMIKGEGSIYTLDGRKLDEQPTKKGVYIMNGNKVVVK